MYASLFSLSPFGGRDALLQKFATLKAILKAGSFVLEPALEELVDYFASGYLGTPPSPAVKRPTSLIALLFQAIFPPGNHLAPSVTVQVFSAPTRTSPSLHLPSTGYGVLIGVVACTAIGVVGATLAVAPRANANHSGEDGDPSDEPDSLQGEDTRNGGPQEDPTPGSSPPPPPPPPPPSSNGTDMGDFGNGPARYIICWIAFLLLVAREIFSSVKKWDTSRYKPMSTKMFMRVARPATESNHLDNLEHRSIRTVLPAACPNSIPFPASSKTTSVTKPLVGPYTTPSPVPCLDIVKPVSSNTCINIIPFPPPSIFVPIVLNNLTTPDTVTLAVDKVVRSLSESEIAATAFSSIRDSIHWKSVVIMSILGIIFPSICEIVRVVIAARDDWDVHDPVTSKSVTTQIPCVNQNQAVIGPVLEDEDMLVSSTATVDAPNIGNKRGPRCKQQQTIESPVEDTKAGSAQEVSNQPRNWITIPNSGRRRKRVEKGSMLHLLMMAEGHSC